MDEGPCDVPIKCTLFDPSDFARSVTSLHGACLHLQQEQALMEEDMGSCLLWLTLSRRSTLEGGGEGEGVCLGGGTSSGLSSARFSQHLGHSRRMPI